MARRTPILTRRRKNSSAGASSRWLKARLLASKAPFKVLACGSGWSRFKGPGGDAWSAYLHERERLFNFIRDHKISGVVLLSGDTHFPYVACAPWSEQGGYDLYDLVSSALAQVVSGSPMDLGRIAARMAPDQMIRQPLLGINNAGIIDFDMTGKTPTLGFNVIDIRGKALYDPPTLRADELVNGVSSWARQGAELDGECAVRRSGEASNDRERLRCGDPLFRGVRRARAGPAPVRGLPPAPSTPTSMTSSRAWRPGSPRATATFRWRIRQRFYFRLRLTS
ncbi:alkaline phosphatase D family protein [Caulobacter segnis]